MEDTGVIMLKRPFVLARFGALFAALVAALFVNAGFAQDSPEAMALYNKGVNLLETGKGDAARKAFNTILEKYPASAYSKLAHQELDKTLVGSVEFKELGKLSEKEVRKQLELANAQLQVGRVWKEEAGTQAVSMIAQMMVKRKMFAKNIEVTHKDLPDKKIAVTLTVIR